MLCFGSIFFLGSGLLCIFVKDLVWEWTAWSNRTKGIASERTDDWDTMTTIGGVVSIVLGLFSLYAFFHG